MWHTGREIPRPGAWVLYETHEGYWRTTQNYHTASKLNWIMSWAYIDDIVDAARRIAEEQREVAALRRLYER